MSRIALNLNDFQHIKSDDNTTTLKHRKDGHLLKIMHAALSPDAQTQLKALSSIAQQAKTPEESAEARDQKMARGGELIQHSMPSTMTANTMYGDQEME